MALPDATPVPLRRWAIGTAAAGALIIVLALRQLDTGNAPSLFDAFVLVAAVNWWRLRPERLPATVILEPAGRAAAQWLSIWRWGAVLLAILLSVSWRADHPVALLLAALIPVGNWVMISLFTGRAWSAPESVLRTA